MRTTPIRVFAAPLHCALLVSSPAGRATASAGGGHGAPTPDASAAKTCGALGACAAKNQDPDDDLKVEVRKGEAVAIRARQLRSRHRHVAKAMRELEAKGLRPAFEHGASVIGVSASGKFRKAAARQDATIIEGDVEISFFSYDDGDPSNWEGLIYYKSYKGETLDYVVIDTTGNTGSPAVVTGTQSYYYEPYTLNGQPVDHTLGAAGGRRAGSGAVMRNVAYVRQCPLGNMDCVRDENERNRQRVAQVGSFVQCIGFGCGVAFGSCRDKSYIEWAACTVSNCARSALSCGLDHLLP